jgi:hypothetical protein
LARCCAHSEPATCARRALLSWPLLAACLLLGVAPRACGAAPNEVASFLDLESAVATGGTWRVVASPILFPPASSLRVNSTANATLTLLGDAAACGGLCVLDAQRSGGHLVVSMDHTLIVDGLAFINSLRGPTSEPCVGGVKSGDAQELTISGVCSNANVGLQPW